MTAVTQLPRLSRWRVLLLLPLLLFPLGPAAATDGEGLLRLGLDSTASAAALVRYRREALRLVYARRHDGEELLPGRAGFSAPPVAAGPLQPGGLTAFLWNPLDAGNHRLPEAADPAAPLSSGPTPETRRGLRLDLRPRGRGLLRFLGLADPEAPERSLLLAGRLHGLPAHRIRLAGILALSQPAALESVGAWFPEAPPPAAGPLYHLAGALQGRGESPRRPGALLRLALSGAESLRPGTAVDAVLSVRAPGGAERSFRGDLRLEGAWRSAAYRGPSGLRAAPPGGVARGGAGAGRYRLEGRLDLRRRRRLRVEGHVTGRPLPATTRLGWVRRGVALSWRGSGAAGRVGASLGLRQEGAGGWDIRAGLDVTGRRAGGMGRRTGLLQGGELRVTTLFDAEGVGLVLAPGIDLAPTGRVFPGAEVTLRARVGAELPWTGAPGAGDRAGAALTELSLSLAADHGVLRYEAGLESRGAPAWPGKGSLEESLREAWRLGVGIDLQL